MAHAIAPFVGKQVIAGQTPAACEYVFFEGAVRSSKTVVSIVWWAKFIRTAPDGNLAMFGVTLDTLLRNVVIPMQEMFGENRVAYNRGTGMFTVFGRSGYLVGVDNIKAMKKVQGLSLVGAYVDEAANMPEPVFEMLTTRLSEPGARMIATMNPEGPRHWLLVKYLRRCTWWITRDGQRRIDTEDVEVGGETVKRMPWMRVTFVLEDNAWLCLTNPSYVANIKASKTGVFYRRMILAEWASADGMVYPGFDVQRHTITASQLPPIDRVLCTSLDYGQNHDTRAYLLGLGTMLINARTGLPHHGPREPGGLYRTRDALFVLAEYAPLADLTLGQHVAGFESWLLAHNAWGEPEWHIVDPAAKPFKSEWIARGHTNTRNAANRVLPGIQVVESLIMSGGLIIVRDNCPQLVERLPGYMWDAKATERGTTAVLKENDDEADALRYGVYTTRREWADRIPIAAINENAEEIAA